MYVHICVYYSLENGQLEGHVGEKGQRKGGEGKKEKDREKVKEKEKEKDKDKEKEKEKVKEKENNLRIMKIRTSKHQRNGAKVGGAESWEKGKGGKEGGERRGERLLIIIMTMMMETITRITRTRTTRMTVTIIIRNNYTRQRTLFFNIFIFIFIILWLFSIIFFLDVGVLGGVV